MKNKRMLIFFAVNIVFNMAASFAHPVTPTLFQSLGLGSYMFGYALAAMMTVNFLFSPFWGKLNSFLSSKVSLLIACLGYALGQFFFSIAQTEMQFIFARMLAGLFTGGTFVSILNYVINTSDDESRGTNLTIVATVQSVAGAFGYFIGGMLGEIATQLALNAQVIVLALCGVLFFLVCENDSKQSIKELKFTEVAREANPFSAFIASRKFMTVLLFFLFAVCMFQSLGQTAFDQSFNYYIRDQFNFSSGYNGVLKAIMGIITLVANSTICIFLIRKTDVRRSVIGVLLLCSVTMFGIIFLESPIPFVAFNVIFYAFSSMNLPLLQDIAAASARGKDSNLIMGFYNSMKSLGGIIGAAFSGTFYAVNPKYPFVLSFVSFALAVIFSVMFYRKSLKKDAAG